METKTEDKESKLYYSMGEVARKYEVKHSLIRYWEREFDVIKPKKNKKGNRLFTKRDLDAFDLIYDLVKNKGYTLEGAKQKIKEGNDDGMKKEELMDKLKKMKSFLLDLEAKLG